MHHDPFLLDLHCMLYLFHQMQVRYLPPRSSCYHFNINPRFPLFLAHLSRRLTGELIGYPWIRRPSVRPSVVRPFTFSNIFSSETAWPIKAKFYVEPPWEMGTKVYINGPGHMTKMAAMPIYGKNPSKIFFSRTGGLIFTKLGM